jgi:RHS repeat-associated protein
VAMNMSATHSIAPRRVGDRYIPGAAIDERVAQLDPAGNVVFIHNDRQHSKFAIALRATLARGVIAISNILGAVIQKRAYGTYGGEADQGEVRGTSTPPNDTDQMRLQPNATTIHPFGYTGRRWDPDLGLYYYRARWYDPALGTFLETDPIGSLDYINLYSYVGLEPGNGTDPSGLAGAAGAVEIFAAAGAGEGRNSPVLYFSTVLGFSVSRDGRIELGVVVTTSERGAGLGLGATTGPTIFRGPLSGLANNNVTAVAGAGAVGLSSSARFPTDSRGRPVIGQPSGSISGSFSQPRITGRVSAGETYGAAVFDTTTSKAYAVSVNPVEAVRSVIQKVDDEIKRKVQQSQQRTQ